MTPPRDDLDRMLDANLRSVGPVLDLPEDPSPGRLRSWKAALPASAASERPGTLGRIGGFIVAKKTWFAAAAACAAVAAALWPFARGSSVHASTIMASLKATTFESLRVTLSDVETAGVSATGELHLRFSKPLTMQALVDEGEKVDAAVVAAYAKLRATSSGAAAPAFDMHLEAAAAPANTWVYGRADAAGMKDLREHLPPVANMLEQGVLVNFGAVNLADLLDGDEVGEIADGIKEARDELRKEATGHDKGRKVELLVSELLTGKATAETLKELRQMLDDVSVDAKVEHQGGGRYLLTTGTFARALANAGEPAATPAPADEARPGERRVVRKEVRRHREAGDDAAELLAQANLSVLYVEGAGVEWMHLAGVGPRRGSLRVEFGNAAIDAGLLDAARLVAPGKTSVLNFDAIKGMFGGD